MEQLDLLTERYIINRFASMPRLFDSLGIDYRVDGNLYCPFHDNENTPAAHLYNDDNGYRLWCFSENKMYGAWNIYKTFMPHINTNKLALKIFNSLPENKRKQLLDDLNTEQEPEKLPFEQSLKDFKRSKINITELLHNISESYVDDA